MCLRDDDDDDDDDDDEYDNGHHHYCSIEFSVEIPFTIHVCDFIFFDRITAERIRRTI